MDNARAPLLDLGTIVERPFITIDGKPFELRNTDELSVAESLRFGRWGKRLEELQADGGEEIAEELDALVATMARAILVDVPDEVFAGLSGTHRWAIIDVFTGLLLRTKLKVAGAMTTATGPIPNGLGSLTGASFSPGSSVSTAGASATGFTARLRRWFGRS
ncbi:hypothetical protein [Erythrobacter sp. WG]|uniref:hypothetical protein n=1 Tax=Erythrobacter sp. WG TaxID=2985510 RepID=UPI002270D05B|nr:hypothetical protein [Erythrobacter sp. WG]MCX9146621.1 hypothetical protein [Erythrobacter sp. WG]